jgi:hypothetical protein
MELTILCVFLGSLATLFVLAIREASLPFWVFDYRELTNFIGLKSTDEIREYLVRWGMLDDETDKPTRLAYCLGLVRRPMFGKPKWHTATLMMLGRQQCPGPNDYYGDNGNLRSDDGEILD